MLRTEIETLNYIAGTVFAQMVNAALPGAVAIALTALLAWHKRWNAASRYCACWLMLALLVVLPFAPKLQPAMAAPLPVSRTLAAPAIVPPVITPFQSSVALNPAPVPEPIRPSGVAIFLLCWMSAACLQLTRIVRGILRGWQLKRESQRPSVEVESLFHQLLQTAGSTRSAELRISHHIESPAVLGYLRPQILLPASLLDHLDRQDLEQVLLHEIAHLARWDDCTIAAQRILEALGIFHPLVAWLGHRMNIAREMAADDFVAARCDARDYAACLTRIAEFRAFGPPSLATAPLLLERKPELLSRVESLLDQTRGHLPEISIRRLSVAFACAVVIGTAGAFTPRVLAAPASPAQTPSPAKAQPPASKPAQDTTSSSSVSGIRVTGENGSSANFGSWSYGDEGSQSGTVTFNSSGKRYVIRDPSTLSEAAKILAPMEELGQKQAALGEQQSKLGEQQSALGAKQQELIEKPLDSAQLKELQDQLKNVEAQIRQIDVEKELKTARDAMQRLADLQSRLGEMQSEMGVNEGLTGRQQGELGREQGKLGEEQGRLGRLQGQLGAQQARELKRALKQLQDLIERARRNGLAQPLQ